MSRWYSICKEASEQSKRNIIPNIYKPINIKEMVKIDSDFKFVASTKSNIELVSNYLNNNKNIKKIMVVIGPEGGFSEEEESFLNDNGFTSISFGKRIMRVETAAIYIASVVSYIGM